MLISNKIINSKTIKHLENLVHIATIWIYVFIHNFNNQMHFLKKYPSRYLPFSSFEIYKIYKTHSNKSQSSNETEYLIMRLWYEHLRFNTLNKWLMLSARKTLKHFRLLTSFALYLYGLYGLWVSIFCTNSKHFIQSIQYEIQMIHYAQIIHTVHKFTAEKSLMFSHYFFGLFFVG